MGSAPSATSTAGGARELQPVAQADLATSKKGGIHNAFNPVNSELTASNQKSAQQIMRENKAKKSGMSREDERKLYLASLGK